MLTDEDKEIPDDEFAESYQNEWQAWASAWQYAINFKESQATPERNNAYVIVENVPVRQHGEYYMGKDVVTSLGAYCDKAEAQNKVDELNQDACDDSMYAVVPLKQIK